MGDIAQQLKTNSCAFVKGFITTEEAELFTQELVHARQNNLLHYEPECKGYAIYDHPIFVKLLVKKNAEVSEMIGEDVLPTYTYARIYTKGSELTRHKDRPACDISFTVNLKQDAKWLIAAEAPNGTAISFDLQPGDAMLYYGCDAPHWREGLFDGEEYIQVFIHYVRMAGPRASSYFDRRF
jgi:hypothetical protein